MSWWTRLGLGAGLGLVAALALGWLLDGWAIPAAVGALLAAIGFLGSFFVWSADVPPSPENPEGYEQVLFDGPNVVASLLVVAGVVALAFFVRFDATAPAAEDHSAYVAQQDAVAKDLESMREYVVAERATRAEGKVSDADHRAALKDLSDAVRAIENDLDALEPPEAFVLSVERLDDAVAGLLDAIALLDSCAAGNAGDCGVEEEFLAETEAALADYASGAGAASSA